MDVFEQRWEELREWGGCIPTKEQHDFMGRLREIMTVLDEKYPDHIAHVDEKEWTPKVGEYICFIMIILRGE